MSLGERGRLLEAHRIAVLEILARVGASNVRVFGSIARGEDDETSDVDLLVDLPAGDTVMTVAGLSEELSNLLGCRADVATVELLRPELRGMVLREAVPL